MRRTLQEQIQANKRLSLFYAALLVVLLTVLGTVIVGSYDPKLWPVGLVGSLLLGVGSAIFARFQGPALILRMSGVREATGPEDRQLRNVTEEIAIAAGLPLPTIMVIDDSAPNAFATGSDPENGVIAVTTGLLAKLDRDELQGVIAHEMAHIRNYDIRFMSTICIIAGLIPLISDFYLHSLWYGGGRRRDNDRDNNLGPILMVIGIVLAILAPVFSKLLELAVSRRREFLADATAAELTRYPEGLARALQKIARDPEPLEAANRATQHLYIVNPLKMAERAQSLFSTHPSTDERVRALMGLAGNPTLEN
ncbi:MAG: M48 family metallopeptidase [Fimbriimonas sp.]